jgi:hypothetical protein
MVISAACAAAASTHDISVALRMAVRFMVDAPFAGIVAERAGAQQYFAAAMALALFEVPPFKVNSEHDNPVSRFCASHAERA